MFSFHFFFVRSPLQLSVRFVVNRSVLNTQNQIIVKIAIIYYDQHLFCLFNKLGNKHVFA